MLADLLNLGLHQLFAFCEHQKTFSRWEIDLTAASDQRSALPYRRL